MTSDNNSRTVMLMRYAKIRTEKTMTATDATGFDAIFSTGFFAPFSRFWGARLTKLHINTGEKAKKSSGEPPVETGAPKLQISVPCRGRTCPEKKSHMFSSPLVHAC